MMADVANLYGYLAAGDVVRLSLVSVSRHSQPPCRLLKGAHEVVLYMTKATNINLDSMTAMRIIREDKRFYMQFGEDR